MFATGVRAQSPDACTGDGPYEVPSNWALKPSGVSAGDSFRLLFVTSTTRNATATGIGTYNTFVQTRAKAGHSAITDSCGNQFKVVGSTSAVDARDNTSTTGAGQAIYWLNGAKVADNYADFYDGSWDSYAKKTEAGANHTGTIFSFTGSNQDGTKSGRPLGNSGLVTIGYPLSGQNPLSSNSSTRLGSRSFYALSPIFTVAVPDTTAPSVTSIERQTPNSSPTNADSVKWRVTFNEAVQHVDAADFQVSGTTATITAVSPVSGFETTTYDVTTTGGNLAGLNATVTLSFASGHNIQDMAGNALAASPTVGGTNDNSYVVDNTAPGVTSITRQTPMTTSTGADSLTWRVTFDEAVQHVDAADFQVSGTTATITAVSPVSGFETTTYDVTTTGGNLAGLNATVTLSFAGTHNIEDEAGNDLAASPTPTGTDHNTFVVQNTASTHTVSISAPTDANEGNSGTTDKFFTINLSSALTQNLDLRICFTGTATRGASDDYQSLLDTTVFAGQCLNLTLDAGDTTDNVHGIRTNGDTTAEPDETVIATLSLTGSPPAGVTLGTSTATYTILDDDTPAKANKEPGLVFDNAHLTWNEADGCGNTGPTYKVKLKTKPLGPVEVFIEDPDDNYRSDSVAKGRLSIDNTPPSVGEQGGAYEIHDDGTYSTHPLPKLDEDTVLRFTPGNWDTWQPVNVKVKCANHYTAQIPIKHRMYAGYIDKYTPDPVYPGFFGIIDKGWTVHVTVRESDPPIVVKHLPAAGQPVDVKDGSHVDFEITLSEAAFEHDSSLTVYLSARGGKAAGVKRRDGDAHSCGGPLDDCLIFTPSNRTQRVRLFAINPGRDELKVEIPQLRWGDLEHGRDWEMRWPVEVIQAGQGSPQQDEDAQPAQIETPSCVSDALLTDVDDRTANSGTPAGTERWTQVKNALTGQSNAITLAEVKTIYDRRTQNGWSTAQWDPVIEAMECQAAAPEEQAVQPEQAEAQPVTPATRELSLRAGSAVDEGGNATFTVTAVPAPQSDLTVTYTVAQSGEYLAAPGAGSRTVVLTAGATSIALSVATMDDAADEVDGSVSVALGTGTGYTVTTGKGSAAVAVRDNDEPVVSIAAGSGVTEGASASFTVSASPVPAVPLDVTLTVGQSWDFAASGETGSRTVTIPVTGSVEVEVATVDDAADEPDGSITASVGTGTGYTVAAAADNAATVAVSDNDVASGPTISIADATMKENWRNGHFTVTLSEPVDWPVTVHYATRDSSPVSAVAGEDYLAWQRSWRLRARFRPGETETLIHVPLYNDSHDEDPETFELVLFNADVNGPPGVSVSIADGVAVGTITD